MLKPNSYLASFLCYGLANPSTSTFPKISLKQAMSNVLVAWKTTEKWLQNLYLHRYIFNISYNLFSYLTSLSHQPGKSVNPNFR